MTFGDLPNLDSKFFKNIIRTKTTCKKLPHLILASLNGSS